ncbi:MAG: hypothetical protein APF81_06720 [Desulfosporosinus sp. BRH_c37]|nr:MAG: hypothetical protein APF81_06720 [Desulfosporosinus sp. BRH_c37]
MSWYRKKIDSTKKDKLKAEISVILEKYKPAILNKLEEFNNMDGLKTIKYIRTWTLLREIERTHLIKKLLILWLSGIFNFILKWVNKEIVLETLDEKRHTKERITNNENLKNRAQLDALDRVRTLVVENIEDSKAKVQVLYSN